MESTTVVSTPVQTYIKAFFVLFILLGSQAHAQISLGSNGNIYAGGKNFAGRNFGGVQVTGNSDSSSDEEDQLRWAATIGIRQADKIAITTHLPTNLARENLSITTRLCSEDNGCTLISSWNDPVNKTQAFDAYQIGNAIRNLGGVKNPYIEIRMFKTPHYIFVRTDELIGYGAIRVSSLHDIRQLRILDIHNRTTLGTAEAFIGQ